MTRPYIIGLTKRSLREFNQLDHAVMDRVLTKVFVLARAPQVFHLEALKGQWEGCYKLRIGDYRVIYSIDHDEQVMIIESVGHRREVYGGD